MSECCKTLKEAKDCRNPNCDKRKELLNKIKQSLENIGGKG